MRLETIRPMPQTGTTASPGRPGVVTNLIAGNGEALRLAGSTLSQAVRHPLTTAKTMAGDMLHLVTRPGETVGNVLKAGKANKIEGLTQGATVASAYGGLAAAGLMATAYLAAIPTRGRSFALLATAGQVGRVSGQVGLTAMAGSFLHHETQVALAPDAATRQTKAKQLAGDYVNATMVAGAMAGGAAAGAVWKRYLPKNVNPGCGQRVADRLHGRLATKLGVADKTTPLRGRSLEGLDLEGMRAAALQDVKTAMQQGPQGGKILKVTNVDRGSFDGITNLGERRVMYHGTRIAHAESIAQSGLRPSKYGDFGDGVYLGDTATIGENYASTVAMREKPYQRALFTMEVATGKVFDFHTGKADFLKWAKERFDPTDMSLDLNRTYANLPKTSTSPFADLTWNRYLKLYCQEKGFDSIRIRDWDGIGQDYFVVHDPRRIILRQQILMDPPTVTTTVPTGINGRLAGVVGVGAAAGTPER